MTNMHSSELQASSKKLVRTLEKRFKQYELIGKLANIQSQVEIEQNTVDEIEARMQKEFNDVEILKTNNFAKFLYEVFGSLPLDEKLKIEKQELHDAQITYAGAVDALEGLRMQADHIDEELIGYKDIDEKLAKLGREAKPAEQNDSAQLAFQIAQSYSKIEQVNRAITIGRYAEEKLIEAYDFSIESREFNKVPDFKTLKSEYKLFRRAVNNLQKFCRTVDKITINNKPLDISTDQLTKDYPNILSMKVLESTHSNSHKFESSFQFNSKNIKSLQSTIGFYKQLVSKQIEELSQHNQKELIYKSNLENTWESRFLE